MEDFEFLGQIDKINRKERHKKRNDNREESVQVMVCAYLRFKHPDILFRADTTAGMKLSIGQSVKAKKLGGNTKAWPDIGIFEPRGSFHGLFLELKKEGTKIFKEDGTPYKNEHQIAQLETLQKLRDKGYSADFAVGYFEAVKKIEDYLVISS